MRSNPGLVMGPERFLLICVTDHGFCLAHSSLFRQQLWVQSQDNYLFYITEQLSNLCVLYSAIVVNTGLIQSLPVPVSVGIFSTIALHIQICQCFSYHYCFLYGVPPDFGLFYYPFLPGCVPAHSHQIIH